MVKKILYTVLGLVVLLFAAVGIAVAMIDEEEIKVMASKAAEEATGRQLAFNGAFKISILPLPHLALEDVTFSNADWSEKKEMVSVGKLEASVSILPLISGHVHIPELVIQDVSVLLETSKTGTPNWQFGEVKPQEQSQQESADKGSAAKGDLPASFGELRLENVKLTVADHQMDKVDVYEIANLKAQSAGSKGLMIDGNGTILGRALQVAANGGSLDILLGKKVPFPIDATVQLGDDTVTVKGQIANLEALSGIDLKVGVSLPNVQKTAELVGAEAAKPVPAEDLELTSRILGDPKNITVRDLSLRLGQNTITGEATYQQAGAKPSLVASLSSKRLDIIKYLGGAKDEQAKAEDKSAPKPADKTTKEPAQQKTETPLDLKVMQQLNADVTVKVGQFIATKLPLENIDVRAVLKDGVLTVKPFDWLVAGGQFNNSLSLDGASGDAARMALSVASSPVNLTKLTQPYTLTQMVTGDFRTAIDMKTRGATVEALKQNLNGKFDLAVGKGTIENEYVNLLAADLLGEFFKAKTKSTVLNCGVVAFEIDKGIADAKALVVETDKIVLGGSGTINIAKDKIDLRFKPESKDPALLSIGVPFRVSGSLTSPSVGIDEASVAKGVALGILSASNPATLLLGTMTTGSGDSPCGSIVDKDGQVQDVKKASETAKEKVKQQGLGILGNILNGAKKKQ